jgi:type IV pilus assembly protein PilP
MNPRSLIPLGCITLMLVACSGENDDLRAWMDQQAQAAKPNVSPSLRPASSSPSPMQAPVARTRSVRASWWPGLA